MQKKKRGRPPGKKAAPKATRANKAQDKKTPPSYPSQDVPGSAEKPWKIVEGLPMAPAKGKVPESYVRALVTDLALLEDGTRHMIIRGRSSKFIRAVVDRHYPTWNVRIRQQADKTCFVWRAL